MIRGRESASSLWRWLAPPDRNLISFEFQVGVNFMGLWDARPDDSFGAAIDYSRVSPYVASFDRVAASFSDVPVPVRDYELLLEATYQAQIVQGFFIQPDFQYVFHPGGGAIDPLNPFVGRIPDAAVFGLRTRREVLVPLGGARGRRSAGSSARDRLKVAQSNCRTAQVADATRRDRRSDR